MKRVIFLFANRSPTNRVPKLLGPFLNMKDLSALNKRPIGVAMVKKNQCP
jgi:hypothetical protein